MANTFKFGNGNWAVKDGYALAYNDENNNFKPLPFDFTRASTATRVNKQGLIETVPSGKPRIDFLNNTKGHLLLEPSRTNVMSYSENFSEWSVVNVGVVDNQSISPDGNLTADFVKENDGVNSKFIYLNESVTSGNDYTYSVFAKYNGTRYIQLTGSVGFGTGHVNFDLQDGTITLESAVLNASIEKYPSDWYRISVTLSCTLTTTVGRCLISLIGSATSGRVGTYSGDTSKGVYLWGAQLEIGDYATSYIPTEGSSVTRAAEVANGSGNSTVFNDSEGVLFVETSMLSSNPNNSTFQIDDGTSTNRVRIRFTTTTNQINGLLYSGVSGQPNINYTANDVTNQNKVAIRYQVGQIDLFFNGSKVGTSTGNATPTGFNNLSLGVEGKVKDLKVYNTALTDTELQNLTS